MHTQYINLRLQWGCDSTYLFTYSTSCTFRLERMNLKKKKKGTAVTSIYCDTLQYSLNKHLTAYLANLATVAVDCKKYPKIKAPRECFLHMVSDLTTSGKHKEIIRLLLKRIDNFET